MNQTEASVNLGTTPRRHVLYNRVFDQWWAEHRHQFPRETPYWVARAIWEAARA